MDAGLRVMVPLQATVPTPLSIAQVVASVTSPQDNVVASPAVIVAGFALNAPIAGFGVFDSSRFAVTFAFVIVTVLSDGPYPVARPRIRNVAGESPVAV